MFPCIARHALLDSATPVTARVLAEDADAALAALAAAGIVERRCSESGEIIALTADDVRRPTWPSEAEGASGRVELLSWMLGDDFHSPEWLTISQMRIALAAHLGMAAEAAAENAVAAERCAKTCAERLGDDSAEYERRHAAREAERAAAAREHANAAAVRAEAASAALAR